MPPESAVRAVRTLEERAHLLEDGEAADAKVLAKAVFHEEEGHANEQHHDDIGDEERACRKSETHTTLTTRLAMYSGKVYTVETGYSGRLQEV